MRPDYCPIGGEPCQSVCADHTPNTEAQRAAVGGPTGAQS